MAMAKRVVPKSNDGAEPKVPQEGQKVRATDLVMASQVFTLAKRVFMGADDKKRIALGKLASKSEGYNVYVNEQGQIVLDPIATIPERERWVFDNPEHIASIDRGLAQAANGELGEWPDFNTHDDD